MKTEIECKNSTCDNRVKLEAHHNLANDTYFVGYCCDQCGWIKIISGPHTLSAAEAIIKNQTIGVD